MVPFPSFSTEMRYTLHPMVTIAGLKIGVINPQCEKLRIFQPLRFYVKSIKTNLE